MRVLIVDDHPLYRQGLRTLLLSLNSNIDATDVGTAQEAIDLASRNPPDQAFDLILLDMNLPGVGRVDALIAVKAAHEHSIVVVVSGDEDPVLILKAIEQGAAGYIPKSTDSTLTIEALRLVLAKGVYLPPQALRIASYAPMPKPAGVPDLSPKQRDVVDRLMQGKSNKVIARELQMAEGTVKAHLWAVYQALGVSSRTQAMFRMHELGLMDGKP